MSGLVTISLVERVQELIKSGDFQLPAVPQLALRLREALEDRNRSREAIVELIRGEPAVTVALLRTANCPAYGFKATTDLSQAVMNLGLRQVESIVTAVLLKGQFAINEDSKMKTLEGLWDHGIASAAVAKRLAKRQGYPADDAFLAGLLHGIGRWIVLRALDHLAQVDNTFDTDREAIADVVEALQYEIGYSTLWSWNLSEDICEASRAMGPDADSSRPIVQLVQAADLIVQKLGIHPSPDTDLELLDHDAIQALGIEADELPAQLTELEREIDETRFAFSAT